MCIRDSYSNTVPAGAFRGFGGHQTAFAIESHTDMLAHRLGIDPVEFRLKNLLEKGEEYAAEDTPIDCDVKDLLRRLSQAIGWTAESGEPQPVSYTHLRAHETPEHLVCRL